MNRGYPPRGLLVVVGHPEHRGTDAHPGEGRDEPAPPGPGPGPDQPEDRYRASPQPAVGRPAQEIEGVPQGEHVPTVEKSRRSAGHGGRQGQETTEHGECRILSGPSEHERSIPGTNRDFHRNSARCPVNYPIYKETARRLSKVTAHLVVLALLVSLAAAADGRAPVDIGACRYQGMAGTLGGDSAPRPVRHSPYPAAPGRCATCISTSRSRPSGSERTPTTSGGRRSRTESVLV